MGGSRGRPKKKTKQPINLLLLPGEALASGGNKTQTKALRREYAVTSRENILTFERKLAGGGVPPGMEALFSDPEIMKAMQNPKVMSVCLFFI